MLSIGLALLGAYGLIVNVGDWGWLIGAGSAGIIYRALCGQTAELVAIARRGIAAGAGFIGKLSLGAAPAAG